MDDVMLDSTMVIVLMAFLLAGLIYLTTRWFYG